MPAVQGAPSRRNAVSFPGWCPSRNARLRTRSSAGVVLWAVGAMIAGASLAGCEYTYEDGRNLPDPAASAAPAATAPVFTRDPRRDDPVSEAEVGPWLEEALPETKQQVIHMDHGLLAGNQAQTEEAAGLPAGTYALSLACKGQRRVTFTVRSDNVTLVDVGLRCGSTRQYVVYISGESMLTFRMESRSAANYAYRLALL
ncbi:hypothetical protein M1E17_18925 [Arthrobacter sp. D1-29]